MNKNQQRFNLFQSKHNHNGSKFNLVHLVPIFASKMKPTKLKYEINGSNISEVKGEHIFIDFNERFPYIVSFLVEKGATYFIKFYIEYMNNKNEVISKFYHVPDDYNMDIVETSMDKIDMEISKINDVDMRKLILENKTSDNVNMMESDDEDSEESEKETDENKNSSQYQSEEEVEESDHEELKE